MAMRHDPEVQQALARYQLGLPRMPVAGRSGELLGRGSGSSLEFQEYREYVPGDDIRHLDWAAYARSDQLMVRLYREEISPQLEVYLDASRSMATGDGAKSRVAKQLAALFLQLAARLGGRPQLWLLDDRRPLATLGLQGLDALTELPLHALTPLPDLLAEGLLPLKPQSVRIVVSDFLFPHDPAPVIRRLASGAGALWVVQLLTAWERRPTESGGRKVIDIETGAATDLLVNRRAIAAYQERLTRLQETLLRECRRAQAPAVCLTADRGLTALCRDDLSAVGMLRAE